MDSHLDKYPHITKRIETLWGTVECRKFLLELLSDSRDGSRQGLPPQVATELMAILTHHDKEFPDFDDSQHFVEMTYRAVPREVRVVNPNEGVVLRFITKILAYVIGFILIALAVKKLL